MLMKVHVNRCNNEGSWMFHTEKCLFKIIITRDSFESQYMHRKRKFIFLSQKAQVNSSQLSGELIPNLPTLGQHISGLIYNIYFKYTD